jgi:DNA-directed RNA polymerase specialized sigma24 family protein
MTEPFAALRALADIPDATERAKQLTAVLAELPDVQAQLKAARQQAVVEMRAGGMSHADVGAELGVSRARAQQIAEGRTTGRRKAEAETE